MNALDIAKYTASMVVGIGTSKITHSIINNNVARETVIDQVTIAAGSLVIGSVVADVTKKHLDDKINGAVDWYHSMREQQN